MAPRVNSATIEAPDAGFDCCCPNECCGCEGRTRECVCNMPDEKGGDA